MRAGAVVLGVLLMVGGAVLAYVPFVPQPEQKVTSTNPLVFNVTALFSLTGTDPLSASWTATVSVTLWAASCDHVNPNGSNLSNICRGFAVIATQNGTSGSFSWAPKLGATVLIGFVPTNLSSTNGTATINVKTAEPAIGWIVFFLGLILLIVRLVVRKRGEPMPASPPPPSLHRTHLGRER